MKSDKKAVAAYAFYDWANSAFALTVMAGFFPGFFKGFWCQGVTNAVSTARLGFGSAIAGFMVAVLSPFLGALAGEGSMKKKMLTFFMIIGALASGALGFIPGGSWVIALGVYLIARIGFSLANLFYDSLLCDVADPAELNMVSSIGYSVGYLGCGLLFLFNIIMYSKPGWFGLESGTDAIKIAFFTVCAWWIFFSLPLIFIVKQRHREKKETLSDLLRGSLNRLVRTAKMVGGQKHILIFLIAYWLYIDGVHTVIMMATDFGLSLGLPMSSLMVALLVVQFVAFPAALIFGLLAQKFSARFAIIVAICLYLVVSVAGAWVLRTTTHFMILAALTGIGQGGIQALSRSWFTQMIPEEKSADFFGFYNLVGRFAVVGGPLIVALVNIILYTFNIDAETTARLGINAISLLFIGGLVLLSKVKVHGANP